MFREISRSFSWSLLLLFLASRVSAEDATPLAGTWRLNIEKSDFASGPPAYSRVTFRIEPHDDGLKVVYDMIGTRGGVTHWEWTGKLDGKDYALQGVEEVVTNAYTRVDDRTFTIVTKLDGRPTGTTRIVVSADRNIMTVTSPATNPQGQRVVNTAIYEKL